MLILAILATAGVLVEPIHPPDPTPQVVEAHTQTVEAGPGNVWTVAGVWRCPMDATDPASGQRAHGSFVYGGYWQPFVEDCEQF